MERCHLQLSVRAARPRPIRNIDLWDSMRTWWIAEAKKNSRGEMGHAFSFPVFAYSVFFSSSFYILISYLDDVLVKSDGMRGICLLFRFRSGLFFRANVLPMKVLWEARFWLAYVDCRVVRILEDAIMRYLISEHDRFK